MKARVLFAIGALALTAASFGACVTMLAASRDFAATYWAMVGLFASQLTGRLAQG